MHFVDMLNQVTGFLTGPAQIALTMGWSWLLKNKTGFSNKMIPALNLGIAGALGVAKFLTALLAGAQVAPAGYVAAVFAVPAASGGILLVWNLVQAVTNALLATGIHSTAKNIKQA